MSKLFVLLTICFSYLLCMVDSSNPKIVIDNDAGGDDALAIFLTLLYEKYHDGPKLVGLTTANGNTNETNVCLNNQRILKVAGRQDVPIFRGARSSLITTPDNGNYYGVDGLGDSGEMYTDLVPPQTNGAVETLIDLSKKYEGQLTVVTIGPVTNVAVAIKNDPSFLDRLAHLYIGAGHIHSAENPKAEFNALMDAEAYQIIVQNANPDKVTLFPFSQARKFCNFSKDWRVNVFGAIDTDIVKHQNKYEKVSLERGDRWQALDPATVAMFLRPDLVEEYRYSKNSINLCGDQRGINTNDFVDKEKANVRIIYSVKTEEYRQFLLDLFAPRDNKTEGS